MYQKTALAYLFMFWKQRNEEKKDRQNKTLVCTRSNSLAHVTDIISSKEEVLKSLVAHFKHACGKREKEKEAQT